MWAGDQLIEAAPIYADGTVAWSQATRWAYAPGGITPLAQQKAGKLWFVVTDHLGTPRELLSEAGEVEWSNSPETWGRQRLWSRPAANDDAIDCPIRFPGQYFDQESGLHYNRHRYYDPASAQYLSSDPLKLGGGFRPQGYVHDPNGWVDPLGLQPCPAGHAVIRHTEGTPDNRFGHFSVEVLHGDTRLHTHQVITSQDHSTTTIVKVRSDSPIKTMSVPLQDAAAAQRYQIDMINRELWPYDKMTNSCVDHVCNVLRSGGYDIGSSAREQFMFLKKLGFF